VENEEREQEVLSLLRRLEIHRLRIRNGLNSAALKGSDAPLWWSIDLDRDRAAVLELKTRLRQLGAAIDDHLDDFSAPELPRPVFPAAYPGKQPDAYISYHRDDEEWTIEQLLPSLEAAGCRVLIDFRDFELGVPHVVNVERAVLAAPHTLAVMSPSWLVSNWHDFEVILASSRDPMGTIRKVIPIKLRPCEPPPRLAMLQAVDLVPPKSGDYLRWQMEGLIGTLLGARRPNGDSDV
jgi:hypothetical protein